MVDQAEQQVQFHVNTQSVSIQPLPEFSSARRGNWFKFGCQMEALDGRFPNVYIG
jgi:hypothetical protein